MNRHLTRRDLLTGAGGAAAAAGLAAGLGVPSSAAAEEPRLPGEPFLYCLNTSTLHGQKLPLPEVIDIAAEAGYGAVEPWVLEIDAYVKRGGSTADLAKQIRDRGLTVESAIAFPEWIVDDDARRARGLEEAKRCMDIVAQIGGKRIAAPPAGATKEPLADLRRAADRYRTLLQIGDRMGVVPEVEVWGPSKTLGRLSEAVFVAMETGHPKACVLPDVYHLYKGGTPLEGLRLLAGTAFHVIHTNDYPAEPPRETITDGHRVFPGDGAAPLGAILRMLRDIGFRGALSLELFNADVWKMDARAAAKTGLEKMRAAVRKALG